jgi:hypothetical protein
MFDPQRAQRRYFPREATLAYISRTLSQGLFEKTQPLLSSFPEERSSRESSLLLAFFLHGTLTVDFGFVAAANPGSAVGGPRGLMRGIAREETAKCSVRPRGMPRRGTQSGVRESLMRVLVGRRIAVDIGSNDT